MSRLVVCGLNFLMVGGASLMSVMVLDVLAKIPRFKVQGSRSMRDDVLMLIELRIMHAS